MHLIPVVLSLAAVIITTQGDTYTTKYDSLDIDDILANKRMTNAYMKCIMGQGRCSPEGREIKSHIPEALQNGCEKCTDSQRNGIRKVIKYMMTNEPTSWQELVDMYDPERTYSAKYEKELSSIEK